MAAKIKVSKELIDAMKTTKKRTSYQKRLDALLIMISQKEMTLPVYQRNSSWTIEKSIELFNFQLLGKALISPISIHEFKVSDKYVKQVDFVSRNEVDLSSRANETILSLVDGQQRLTANYKAYMNAVEFKDIIFDIVRGKFRLNKGKTVLKSCIPIGILYNHNEEVLEKYLKDNSTFNELFSILTKMRSRWAEYQYTLNIANDMTEKEQIEWFEVLNNAGSRVTDVQIKLSKLKLKSGEDFDIYKNFTQIFIEKLTKRFPKMENHFRPFATRVSYPIASLNPAYEIVVRNSEHNTNFATIPSDEKSKLLATENIKTLQKISELTLLSLDKTLDFIEEFKLESQIHRMDYILYIIGYFVFNQDNTSDQLDSLVNWVKTIDFNNKTNHERRFEYSKLIGKVEENNS